MIARTEFRTRRLVFFVSMLFLKAQVILNPQMVFSEEAVVTLRSTVTGNQEQPKVLYLVPWQQAEGPESLYRPLRSLVNEVFEPIERREFIREMNYRINLNSESGDIHHDFHE